MDNLINGTYFWGELHIPQLKNTASNALNAAAISEANDLDKYITKYQKQYLDAMFGKALIASFGDELPTEIKALIVDDLTKESPIANMVYYHWMRANQTLTLPTGEKNLAIMNTQIRSGNEKTTFGWNMGVKWNRKVHDELYEAETLVIYAGTENERTLDWQTDIAEYIDFNHNIFEYINNWNI